MFSMEEGALDIINEAIDKYEKHFDIEINMLDLVHITEGDGYDFSVKGAKKLASLIDKHINTNEHINTPEENEQRVY